MRIGTGTDPKLPLIPGHEIVGEVMECGSRVTEFPQGDRVGVPWLGYTCGQGGFRAAGNENLCDAARFTGYQIDGGYAEYTVAHHRSAALLSEPGTQMTETLSAPGPALENRVPESARAQLQSLKERLRQNPRDQAARQALKELSQAV